MAGAAAPEPTQGATLTQESLQRLPTGRDYQSAVESVPGVTRRPNRAPSAAAPKPPPPPPPPAKPADRKPVDEDDAEYAYEAYEDVPMSAATEVVTIASGRGARGTRGPSEKSGTKGRVEKPAAMTLEIGGRSDGEAEVFASALTVYVPTLGETVLYQHLLLESDTPYLIAVDAVRRAKDRRVQ